MGTKVVWKKPVRMNPVITKVVDSRKKHSLQPTIMKNGCVYIKLSSTTNISWEIGI
jgi:hypothetical protein